MAAHGEPDELLTLAQAARLLGVSDRYLRRVATETAARRAEQAAAIAAGHSPPELPTTYLTASHDGEEKHWRVARGEVERFALERKVPAAVVGYDLTFSAPKSVSILWARADAAGQARILAAIDKAVAVGMDYIQEQAAWVGRGKDHRRAQGLVAADYVHATSRALDPQLHHHVVVANMAESPAGNVMALDGRPFYRPRQDGGLPGRRRAAPRAVARPWAWQWEQVERGLADVAGVSGAAITEMSRRSTEIDEYTAQLGLDSVAARQVATFATRAPKDHAVDPEALRPAWHRRLDAAGFDAAAAADCYGRQAAPLLVTEEDRATLFRTLGGARGVTETASTFDRRDVIQFVAEWSGDRLDATQIADLADEWLTTENVVTLDAATREGRTADVIRLADGRVVSSVAGDALYTTREVLRHRGPPVRHLRAGPPRRRRCRPRGHRGGRAGPAHPASTTSSWRWCAPSPARATGSSACSAPPAPARPPRWRRRCGPGRTPATSPSAPRCRAPTPRSWATAPASRPAPWPA